MIDAHARRAVPSALTIAGSDSGAGAGIQADLKTFAAHGVYGLSVLTAVTAQNTQTVMAIAEVPEEVIALQIDAVLEDIGADAIKVGMLSAATIVETVVDRLEAWGSKHLIVDPVMVSKSGHTLLQDNAVRALVTKLLPLALVVTPNIMEAQILARRSITSLVEAEEAAKAIHALGPRFVVVKGGHLTGLEAVDVIFDGSTIQHLSAGWVDTENTHGTGCTFSSAIAAQLALGTEPTTAIERAKAYLTAALAASYRIGAGHSPVHHLFAFDATATTRQSVTTT
jgi:hydroxymethylpyrimidine/phosphomethylpyrimidine kinase